MSPLYLSDICSSQNFARVDFLEPSSTHSCGTMLLDELTELVASISGSRSASDSCVAFELRSRSCAQVSPATVRSPLALPCHSSLLPSACHAIRRCSHSKTLLHTLRCLATTHAHDSGPLNLRFLAPIHAHAVQDWPVPCLEFLSWRALPGVPILARPIDRRGGGMLAITRAKWQER